MNFNENRKCKYKSIKYMGYGDRIPFGSEYLANSWPGALGQEIWMVLNRLVFSSEGLKLECNFLIGQYCCRVVLALGNIEALGNVINNLV